MLSGTATAQWEAIHTFDVRTGHSYLYRSPNDSRAFLVWVPDMERPVRGIFIGGGLDESVKAFAARFDMGVASISGGGSGAYNNHAPVLMDGLVAMAALGVHPELAHAPYISHGSSTGGAWAYGVAMLNPDRTICFTSNVMAGPNPATPPAAGFKVPAIFTVGETDSLVRADVATANLLDQGRPEGALWGRMIIEDFGHENRRVWRLYYPFWEDMINRRVPADWDPREGPVTLRDIDPSEGWIAYDPSWYEGLTEIFPADAYEGETDGSTSWYPNEGIAVLARSYSSWQQPGYLNIEGIPDFPPNDQGRDAEMELFRAGEAITLTYDDGGVAWDRIEFFKGAERLGEVTAGDPVFEHILEGDRIAQSFTILHHAPGGEIYTARLQGVLVLPPMDAWIYIHRFGWFYDGFEPWLYHTRVDGWIWLQNYDHISDFESTAGFFFFHQDRGAWHWSSIFRLPWTYDYGSDSWERDTFSQ